MNSPSVNGRTRRLLTLSACTLLLAVAGCSGEQDPGELPPPATLTAAPTPDPTSDPLTDSAPDPTSEEQSGAEYTPAELEEALRVVDEEQSLQAVILSDADIRELVPNSGSETPQDLTVSPEECNVFAETDFVEQALSATLAVMTFAGASSLQPDSLSLTSQASTEAIQEQLDANRLQLDQCSEFQMEISGQTVEVAVTGLPVTTDADETFAVGTVVRVPGTIQETVSVTALLGTTTINVTVGSSGERAQDLVRGQSLVDSAVAALQGL